MVLDASSSSIKKREIQITDISQQAMTHKGNVDAKLKRFWEGVFDVTGE